MEAKAEKNKYSKIVANYNERLNIALIVYLIFKHLPYMAVKNQKLHEQFDAAASSSSHSGVMTDGVMSLEWSTSSEWVLVTGGCDGAIRFWDIRQAGCFRVLDQSHSQFGRRPPLLVRPTTTKKSSLTHQSSPAKVRAPQRKAANGNMKPHAAGGCRNNHG